MIRVVIVNYNGEKNLKKCLESVLKNTFEVVVVDDGSEDESVRIVRQFKKVKLIRLKQNVGPALARNLGAKGFKGKYLVFLDVDTVLPKGSLVKAIKEMDKEKNLGAGQFDLKDHKGHFLSWFGLAYQAGKKDKYILGGITAGLVVRNKLFKKIKGFDEDFEIYGEDTDLCWRVWLAGYKVKRLRAKLEHLGKSSLTTKRLMRNGARNNMRMIIKNTDMKSLAIRCSLGWWIVSVVKILRFKFRQAWWIYLGWWQAVLGAGKSLKKRKQVVRVEGNEARMIMFGKIGLAGLLKKGLRWADES